MYIVTIIMDEVQIGAKHFTKGRAGFTPEYICIHIMDGSLVGTDNWFQNDQCQASAHVGIGNDGEIHRYIQNSDSAWACGITTIQGATFKGFKFTKENYIISPNLFTLNIEHEGTPANEITDECYATSSQLIADWCNQYSIPCDADHIVTHSSIYPLHGCPGNAINMDKLIGMAQDIFNNIS